MATVIRVPIGLRNPNFSANAGNSWHRPGQFTAHDTSLWEFKKDVVGKVYGVAMVPHNYSSGGAVKFQIAAAATVGVTTFSVASKAVADGESLNPGSLTDETDQDISIPTSAQYIRKEVSFTLTETLAADDLLVVEINHVGTAANDTLTVNTLLFGAQLEVTVT